MQELPVIGTGWMVNVGLIKDYCVKIKKQNEKGAYVIMHHYGVAALADGLDATSQCEQQLEHLKTQAMNGPHNNKSRGHITMMHVGVEWGHTAELE